MTLHRTVLGCSIGLAAICLAACGGSPVISSQEINPTYDNQQIGFATRDGQSIPVVIAGNPFPGERSVLDRAVLDAMNGSNIVPVVTFAVDPARPATQNARVVLVFNQEPTLLTGSLCRTVPQSRPSTGNDLRVAAAYCTGSQAMSETSGRINGISGPEAAGFHDLVVQLALALFPLVNPNQDGQDGKCTDC